MIELKEYLQKQKISFEEGDIIEDITITQQTDYLQFSLITNIVYRRQLFIKTDKSGRLYITR